MAKCTDEEQCVVLKKLKGEAADAKQHFEKEAAIFLVVRFNFKLPFLTNPPFAHPLHVLQIQSTPLPCFTICPKNTA